MSHPLRRAVPRLPAEWFAFFRLEGGENDRWRCCRIIDTSPLGAGLELFDLEPDEDLSGPVVVSLELKGETRSIIADDLHGSARVGITFPSPSPATRDYLLRLNGVRSRW